MPNIFIRMLAYPILERELLNRIADRDALIVSKNIEIQELRDRLFQRHGLAPSGEHLQQSHIAVPAYRTGKRRLRDMVTPNIVSEEKLTPEEEAQIRESLTQ